MRNRERQTPARIANLAASFPALFSALLGFFFFPSLFEFSDKVTLDVGARTFELRCLPGVHSQLGP